MYGNNIFSFIIKVAFQSDHIFCILITSATILNPYLQYMRAPAAHQNLVLPVFEILAIQGVW